MFIFKGSENRSLVNVIFTLTSEMQSYLDYLSIVHSSKIFSNEKCCPCFFAIRYLKITWLCLKFVIKIKISLC